MESKIYSVCVIDDEPDIRNILAKTLDESRYFHLAGQAESVDEAFDMIQKVHPDAIFLDIKLREGDAFQLLNKLLTERSAMPAVILNTGYSDFEYAQRALNDYKDCVLMILKKPFWEDWAEKEVQIYHDIDNYQNSLKSSFEFIDNRIKIKSDYSTWLIDLEELIFVEVPVGEKGSGKILLVTKENTFTVSKSLATFQESLPNHFIRVSRYCIINTKYFSHINHSDRTLFLKGIKDRSFGLGDAYVSSLFQFLKI